MGEPLLGQESQDPPNGRFAVDRRKTRALARRTLVVFVLAFGLFLMNTVCIDPALHGSVVGLFNVAAVLHFMVMGHTLHRYEEGKKERKIVSRLTVVGCVSITFGMLCQVSQSWIGQHAFLFCEVIGLAAGLSISPVLLFSRYGFDVTCSRQQLA